MKVAVLISGRGSNMENLIKASQLSNNRIQIVQVLSNRKDAPGIKLAQQLGVATEVIEHSTFDSRNSFEEKLTSSLENGGAELICLAGFMRILSPHFVTRWHNKLLNIHPSVLPAFKGLDTHKRAIEAGARFSGCTVHFVNDKLDSGKTIIQKSFFINKGDNIKVLKEKTQKLEHKAFSEAIIRIYRYN